MAQAINFGAANGQQSVQQEESKAAIPEVIAPQITMDKGNPFDIEAVKKGFTVYEAAIQQMQGFLTELVVDDAASAELAVELGTKAKKAINSLEKVRKGVVEAPGSFVKAVNSTAKYYKEQLLPIESMAKQKFGAYTAEQERIRREDERKQREEAERKQREEEAKLKAEADERARLEKEAKAKGEELAPIPEPEPQPEPVAPVAKVEAPKAVRAKSGVASTRSVWKFEITDPTHVPTEFLMVDEKKVRQAVKDGVREIAGVRIFEEKTAVFRTN